MVLGLVHLTQDQKIDVKEDFWEIKWGNSEVFSKYQQVFVKLCDLCRLPYKISKEEYCQKL